MSSSRKRSSVNNSATVKPRACPLRYDWRFAETRSISAYLYDGGALVAAPRQPSTPLSLSGTVENLCKIVVLRVRIGIVLDRVRLRQSGRLTHFSRDVKAMAIERSGVRRTAAF